MDAVRIKDLQIAFGGKVLVDGLSLRVPEGGVCTVTGPSGCGKSSLLKALLGFVEPSAGSLAVFGSELNPRSVWKVRGQVAWVPQEPELGDVTAGEAMRAPFYYKANQRASWAPKKAEQLCRRFLLEGDVLNQPVSKLSGGEKQRVSIIAALLLERPLLLLDEPFSALDRRSKAAVLSALTENGRTVVCASHEPVGLGDREQVVRWND